MIEVKSLKALKMAFRIVVWLYAIGGLLVILAWSLGKPPVGMDWVMICVCVAFFGSKIWRRCCRKSEVKEVK